MTRTRPTRGRLLRRLTTAVASLAVALGGLALTAPAATAATCAGGFTCEGQSYGYRVTGNGVEYDSPRGRFTVATANGFRTEHARLGGGRGDLGYPTGPVRAESWNNMITGSQQWGRYQTFERGVVYASSFGTFAVKGGSSPFAGAHAQQGGGSGLLTYPTGREVRQASGYWYQEFVQGVIYVSPRGTWAVTAERPWGSDYESTASRVHRGLGGGGGVLGYPVGPRTFQSGKHFQQFERGVVYCGGQTWWGERTCAAVTGGFLNVHASSGGGTGSLGYPLFNENRCDVSGRTWWEQTFENAHVEIIPGQPTGVTPDYPHDFCARIF